MQVVLTVLNYRNHTYTWPDLLLRTYHRQAACLLSPSWVTLVPPQTWPTRRPVGRRRNASRICTTYGRNLGSKLVFNSVKPLAWVVWSFSLLAVADHHGVFIFCACRGAFSTVRKCFHKEGKQEYAAKIINKHKLSSRGMYTELGTRWVRVTKIRPYNLTSQLCRWVSSHCSHT